jgi:hypothetical protein
LLEVIAIGRKHAGKDPNINSRFTLRFTFSELVPLNSSCLPLYYIVILSLNLNVIQSSPLPNAKIILKSFTIFFDSAVKTKFLLLAGAYSSLKDCG